MNFKTFRGLLRGAICNRTQAQFAKETGLSPEHVSRMLNNDNIHRPTKQTLIKIAGAAKNGITLHDLEKALNDEDPNYKPKTIEDLERDAANQQAAKDFAPSFEEHAECTAKRIQKAIAEIPTPYIEEGISNLMDKIVNLDLSTFASESDAPVTCLPLAYDVYEPLKYFGHRHTCDKVTPVWLSMTDGLKEAEILILIYHGTAYGKLMILEISSAMKDIEELYGTPNRIYEYENADYNADGVLDEIYELPYYLTIHPVELFKERAQAENLLDAIFGTPFTYPETVKGVGFAINNLPDTFISFVRQHKNTILEDWEFDLERYKEIKTAIENILDNPDQTDANKRLADKLDEIEYACEVSIEKGWRAVISNVMRIETGFEFEYLPPKTEEGKDWLSTDHVILLRNTNAGSDIVKRETLLNIICRYGRELQIKSFGDILFYTMATDIYKMHTYNIRYKTEGTNDSETELEPDEIYENVIFEKDNKDTWPKQTGIYNVWLKDGRNMNIMYIASPVLNNHGAWIKYHKEWSDMIECYSKNPIKTETDVENKDKNTGEN